MHGSANFLTVTLAVLMAFAAAGPLQADVPPPPLAPGATAPDFRLPGVDGKTHSLAEFSAAKVLVVVFTCNHCPTAQLYEDRIKQLVTDFGTQGVAVVAISSSSPKGVRLDELGWTDLDDSFAAMKVRAREHAFNFPYLYDGDEPQAVSMAYGPAATPHAFVFDAERKLAYAGRIDDDERGRAIKQSFVREAIASLLADQQPAVRQTRAVGCSTKWYTKAEQVKAYQEKLAAEPVTVDTAGTNELKALRTGAGSRLRLINFWATWCAPCIVEFPEFVTINRMYRHRDFEFVSVALNRPDERTNVVAFLTQEQASNRNLILADGDRERLLDAFDPKWNGEVPFTVLLAPDGTELYRETGTVDTLKLKRTIVRELNARKPW